MATFERTGPLRLERQLDGSASQSVDCGVAACVMALDDASHGLIRPSTEALRKRLGNDRDATSPDQWKAAIDAYADRFASFGLQPPRTSVVRGQGHDELGRLLHDQRRRVIAALHYGTVANEKGSLLTDEAARRSSELSGGQLRRVGLAQALVGSPLVLLLDEPSAGLDPAQRSRFRAIVAELPSTMTVVVSTHQVDDLSDLFDVVAVMDHGGIVWEGTVAAFLALAPPGVARPAEAAYASLVSAAD